MTIKVIAEASTELERRTVGWGVSFLVGEDLLFDTFSNEDFLKENLVKSGIDIRQLKYIVISHDHWDHTGGLWHILKENPAVKVFICKGFSTEFKEKLSGFKVDVVEVEKPMEIERGIFTSGEIIGTYNNTPLPEQALIIKGDRLTIITGCAHPGIVTMLRRISETFPQRIGLILGGFHLYDKSDTEVHRVVKELIALDVERVAPCHCTGEKAIDIFQREFEDRFIKIHTGTELEV
jgi:7,8-dihydropterin-6-yl-methyl-4-(beta-D-ribofuranosyl)aminobenzene 5'-phosphate synthase